MLLEEGGNVGIGTTSPAKPFHLYGGGENQVARFESSDQYAGIELKDSTSATLPPLISALGNDFRIYGGHASARPTIMTLLSTGNVGIGVTSPGCELDIQANAGPQLRLKNLNTNNASELILDGNRTSDSDSSAVLFHNIGDNIAKITAYRSNANNSGELRFGTGNAGTVGEHLRIDRVGKVAIGTGEAPNQRLDVTSGARATTFDAADSDTWADVLVRNKNGSVNTATGIGFQNNPNYHTNASSGIAAVKSVDNNDYQSDLAFITRRDGATSTEKMRILHDGKVGIGTTSPSRTLHLYEADQAEVLMTTSGASLGGLLYYNDSETKFLMRAGESDGHIAFQTGGTTERMRITSAGFVGIGTASPPSLLSLSHASNTNMIELERTSVSQKWALLIQGASGNEFKIHNETANTDPFTIQTNGNVGIGSTSPVQKLDVNGNINVGTGQLVTPGGVNLALNPNTGTVSIGGIIVATGTGTSTFAGPVTITGKLTATSKSFLIDHPTKENKKLQYASLEGPENGVYVRGKFQGGKYQDNIIDLPDYWVGLVDEDTITINLTPVGKYQQLYVEDIKDNQVFIKSADDSEIKCFYTIYGERKDIEKLEVEF